MGEGSSVYCVNTASPTSLCRRSVMTTLLRQHFRALSVPVTDIYRYQGAREHLCPVSFSIGVRVIHNNKALSIIT